MTIAERVFLDAGLFIGALLRDDSRHTEARGSVDAARNGELAACTAVGVLAEVYATLTWVGAQPPHPPKVAASAVRPLAAAPSRLLILETGLPAGLRMLNLAGGAACGKAASGAQGDKASSTSSPKWSDARAPSSPGRSATISMARTAGESSGLAQA